jgi:hypothetical protein
MARRDGATARPADRGADGPMRGRELRARGRRTLGGLRQPGEAVLKKGTWYVTALTVCDFAALSPDPANQPAVAECYQALGRQVPVPTT